mgnify:CR=1 FL=1
MRVNEVLTRCSTDQYVCIVYSSSNGTYHIYGSVYDIIFTDEYRYNRIGDMFVTKIGAHHETRSDLYLKAIKA